jgi:hypothetical protein
MAPAMTTPQRSSPDAENLDPNLDLRPVGKRRRKRKNAVMSTTEGNDMPATTDTYDALMERAHEAGAEHGRAAASWYFDGNTTTEQYQRVLDAIKAGDPEVYDTFPSEPLAGVWAGDLTPNNLLVALAMDEQHDAADDALSMYEDGFAVAVADEIERMAREALADDDDDTPRVRDLAKQVCGRLTRRTREDGTSYTTLTDEAREWMRDLVQDAHNGMLPDDWKYDAIASTLEFIADRDDWEDAQDEWADGMTDVYSSDLVTWFGSHGAREDYVDRAREEFGDAGESIWDELRRGQFIEAREVIARVAYVLDGFQD